MYYHQIMSWFDRPGLDFRITTTGSGGMLLANKEFHYHHLLTCLVQEPTKENVTMFQAFEWNVTSDGRHWKRLAAQLPVLKAIGIDNIWLPPGCKAGSSRSNGYDIYDLYDLGEFDQKSSKATKWGAKEDLMDLAKAADDIGIGLYWDAVLNHRAAADRKERCKVVEVDPKNRMKEISKPYEIEAWLGFDFPGRGDTYSSMKYNWHHFSGTDYNAANKKKAIYKIHGENKGWASSVSKENGNYDYLMFADVDYSNREVCDDVKKWAVWIVEEMGLKGFRLDAIKHFSARFTKELIIHLKKHLDREIFVVGEYWSGNVDELTRWLSKMRHTLSLFDVPLLYNFSKISKSKRADLRKVFNKSLVYARPSSAVVSEMIPSTDSSSLAT
jgi:alpha-amylase